MAAKGGDVMEKSLGRVQLLTESGERILVPKPSSDPNDPLNWSTPFKYYVAIVTCFGMLMCTFLAAGPTVAIVQIAMDFGGGPTANLAVLIPQVSFFFTTSALTQGTGNLLWQPLINKYGRRPIYIISFTGYLATAVWSGLSTGYTSELIARILLGLFSGAGECLGPATITDVFFLHERGTAMAMYNFATGSGVSIGIIISGVITLNNSWRVIYWAGAIMIGFLIILIIFTIPETAYNRSYDDSDDGDIIEDKKIPYRLRYSPLLPGISPKKKSYWSTLSIFTGATYTQDSLWKMFIRPFGLIILPPVLWATLVMSALVGFTVALSSAFANDFQRVYSFTPFQAGLGFFGSLVGGIFAIPVGGPVGDAVANYFTVRNRGIREPEFRLPAIAISIITAPLGLILYGAGLQYKLHFMVPIIGLGLVSFSGGQAINISFVYTLDAYGPVSGEVTIAQLAFKSIIGFGLSATTNSWIAGAGELVALGEMAAITAFVLLLAIPMFFWGAELRRWSLGWRAVRFIQWEK
ncbi:MFS general substrate transporter, partial [Stipitochalara longipes BDJ]